MCLEFVLGEIHCELPVLKMRENGFHGIVHLVDLFLEILDSCRVFLSVQFEFCLHLYLTNVRGELLCFVKVFLGSRQTRLFFQRLGAFLSFF